MANNIAVAPDYQDVLSSEEAATRPTLWSTLKDVLGWSRSSNREVENFIQANGGVLTDSLERDISRRFGHIVGQ